MTFLMIAKRPTEEASFEALNIYEDIWVTKNGINVVCFSNLFFNVSKKSTCDLEAFEVVVLGQVSASRDVSEFFPPLAMNWENSVAVHQYEDGLSIDKETESVYQMTMNNISATVSKHPSQLDVVASTTAEGRKYSVIKIYINPPVKRGETRAIKLFYYIPSRVYEKEGGRFRLRMYPYYPQWVRNIDQNEAGEIEVIRTRRYGPQLALPYKFELDTQRTSKFVWSEDNPCDSCERYCPYLEKVHAKVPELGREPGFFFKLSRAKTTNLFRGRGAIMTVEYTDSTLKKGEKKLGILRWLKGPKEE